jgi:hypothetical protein
MQHTRMLKKVQQLSASLWIVFVFVELGIRHDAASRKLSAHAKSYNSRTNTFA